MKKFIALTLALLLVCFCAMPVFAMTIEEQIAIQEEIDEFLSAVRQEEPLDGDADYRPGDRYVPTPDYQPGVVVDEAPAASPKTNVNVNIALVCVAAVASLTVAGVCFAKA